jgi:hypothetical protein
MGRGRIRKGKSEGAELSTGISKAAVGQTPPGTAQAAIEKIISRDNTGCC